MQAQQWTVQVYINEDGDDTAARAVLTTRDGKHLAGRGRARRNPVDHPVAEIGDELASARALADLAEQLRVITELDIERLAEPRVPTRSW